MEYKYPFFNPELPLKERVRDLLSRLTIEEKIGFIPPRHNEVERLGIPAWILGAEGAHGFVDREEQSTTFTQTIGLASSWDRSLLLRIGKAIAAEARVFYNRRGKKEGLAIWSPTIDLERDPRWGRTEEGYGEDPFLTSELSVNFIKGAQGDDPFYLTVSCGPKHFFANNNEVDRGSCSCSIPSRCLHEYYLVPFKNAVEKAKAVSMMTAYNEVNGIPMNIHPILKDVVKKEWGFEGHFVTDGGDLMGTVNQHHYFDTHAEGFAASLKMGSDTMNDDVRFVIPVIQEALERKLISEADIDEHLERILEIRFRFGHFDPPGRCPYDKLNDSDLMKKEYSDLALESVKKSAVLLKNEDNFLPLKPKSVNGTIALLGPMAGELFLDYYAGLPQYKITPLDGLRELYGDNRITYTDCRDIVHFTTHDGRPLVMADTDKPGTKALAVGNLGEAPARFYREDWGWGASTFACVENNFLLEVPYDRPPPEKIEENSNLKIIAGGINNPIMWFNRILINPIPQGDNLFILRTYDNRRIIAPKKSGFAALCDCDSMDSRELFRITVEEDGMAEAEAAAAKAGQVIFFGGNDPMINGRESYDRPSLNLPPRQEEMIKRISAVNPKTALVLLSGYPFTCKKTIKNIPAVIWMAHGIQETGRGLAEILSGAYSPAGRLPLTWYENENQLPPLMEYDIISAGTTYQYFTGKTMFPFGYGLSYSSFTYSNLSIDKTSANESDTVTVSFKLKNTGSMAAEEVPQMYAAVTGSVFRRPLKSLKGFNRILLKKNEERTVSFSLPVSELAVWDPFQGRFCVETGHCAISVGSSSADIRLTGGFDIQGEAVLPRKLKGAFYAERFDDYSNCFLHEKRGSGIPAVFGKGKESWVRFSALNFADGVTSCSAHVQGGMDSRIEIRLDRPDGELAGTIAVPNTGDITFYPLVSGASPRRRPVWAQIDCIVKKICGVRDLYLVLHGKTAVWNIEFK